jgi:hypothetical protein
VTEPQREQAAIEKEHKKEEIRRISTLKTSKYKI